MSQRRLSRATLTRASLSMLVGLAAVAVPLWAMGPGLGSGSDPDDGSTETGRPSAAGAAAGAGAPKTSMVSLAVPPVDGPADSIRLSTASPGAPKVVVAKLAAEQTQDYGLLGVTWEAGTGSRGLEVQVRTLVGDVWSPWQHLEVDQDGPSASGRPDTADAQQVRAGTQPTWVGQADGVAVRLLSPPGPAPQDVQVALIDGGTGLAAEPAPDVAPSAAEPAARLAAGTTTTDGLPPRPAIVTRKQWGVNTSTEVSCGSPATAPTMSGVVLHHTVNSNDYTREEAPSIVRAIHMYHTQSRGWCDIGYNFLADRFGVIYQGRRGGIDNQVRGAHAGNWDVNLYTTGISMIGDFEKVTVPQVLKDSVVAFMAWRLASFGVDPLGTATFDGKQLPTISGHRDVYLSGIRPATATACPGSYAYDWVDADLRPEVQQAIEEARTSTPAPSPSPTPTAPPEPMVSRVAADDRYATAAAIAQDSFTGPVDSVFLASGENFPDALSAGPAAGGARGPILLAQRHALPDATVAALQNLQPRTVYILGGESTLSNAVANEAASYASTVTRLAGTDRYTTGVKVSQTFWPSSPGVVYLASGASFPDALSGGALAAHQGAPILLSRADGLPPSVPSELSRLQPSRVVLLGGEQTLSPQVAVEVAQALPYASVTRLAGADRFATSAAIAQAGWSSSARGYYAVGGKFPDALAGVPAAAVHGAPLLLARPSCLPGPVDDVTTALGLYDRVLLGGESSLSGDAATTRCAG